MIVVLMPAGEVTVPRSMVERIEKSKSVVEEYEEKEDGIDQADAGAWVKLGLWCRAKNLPVREREAFEKAIEIDPDHEIARKHLGYEKVDGVWLQGDDIFRAKGLVRYGDRWVTPAQRDELTARDREEARRVKREDELHESEKQKLEAEAKLIEAEAKLADATGFDAQRIEIDILELASQIEDTTNYQAGAVREISFLVEQYDAICERLGVDVITEDMYEADQAVYHVMRSFSQALAAARARQGLIDEGNFIYFQDLGINGAAAQRELIAYLEAEQQVLNQGKVPTFEMQRAWLRAVGEKFAPEVSRYAVARGLIPFVDAALGTRQLEAAE
jgi:hypothetical protein